MSINPLLFIYYLPALFVYLYDLSFFVFVFVFWKRLRTRLPISITKKVKKNVIVNHNKYFLH